MNYPIFATQVSLLAALHDPNPTPFFNPSKTVALPVMPKTICKARKGDRLEITIRCNGVEVHNQSKTIAPRPVGVGYPCTHLPASAPLKTSILGTGGFLTFWRLDFAPSVALRSSQPKPSFLSNGIDFGIGFVKNVPKGAVESGHQLTAFASDLVSHPIDTSYSVCSAFATLAELASTQQWSALSESLAPEVCQLANEWNFLTARAQGERSGYIFGKYGADILIPGAMAKVLSKGIEGAKNLIVVAKNLQTAEQTFALEALAASASRAGVVEDFPVLFKNGERIEGGVEDIVVHSKHEQTLREMGLWDSFKKYEKAEAFLKPYQRTYLSENQVRDLIHQTGIPTFPRPQGIPENFRITVSNEGAGMKYIHPDHEHTSVRVMPGKPHSPNPLQRKPYVVYMKNGQYLDKYGKYLPKDRVIEAHILLDEFVFIE